MKARIIPGFLLFVLAFGCEEEVKRSYPIIKTGLPTHVTSAGATYRATIEPREGVEVTNHGFIWYSSSVGAVNISLGPTRATNVSYEARSAIIEETTHVKAYLRTADLIVYGEEITFQGMGSEGPVITSFSPTTAMPLDTITVIGRNFVSSPMEVSSSSGYFTYTSNTRQGSTITTFTIPYSATASQNLKLTVGNQQADFPQPLVIEVPYWKQLSSFPGPSRYNAFSFSVNGKGYMGTGTGASGLLADFWEYNPTSDTWTQLPDFPGGARANASSFVIDGKAYVGLGEAGVLWSDSKSDLWMFDPASGQWTPRAAYVNKRWSSMAFSLNGKGYFGGGKNQIGLDALDFWEYDPSLNSWTQKPNIPKAIVKSRSAHYSHAGTLHYFSADGSYYKYATVNGLWLEELTPFPLNQEGWANMILSDQVIVLGPEVMQVTGDVLTMIRFPYNGPIRRGGFSFVIDGKGYYGLGRSDSNQLLNDVMEFDPSLF